MAGAVLNALNYRLDARTIAFILGHAETKVLITDREFSSTIQEALRLQRPQAAGDRHRRPALRGRRVAGRDGLRAVLAQGDPNFAWEMPGDEWDAISLNYTSGTTGDPKGVVYHHRGAFLNALGDIMYFGLTPQSVYLWTLPMFHCNGWSYTWAVTGGGRHACLPAPHRSGGDILLDRRAARNPSLRRAHRPEHARPRARGGQAPLRPSGQGDDRRRCAALDRHRQHGAVGVRGDARLWPHRILRPGDDLLPARGVGRASPRRARGQDGAARRGRARRWPPCASPIPGPCATCRPTAPPSAS